MSLRVSQQAGFPLLTQPRKIIATISVPRPKDLRQIRSLGSKVFSSGSSRSQVSRSPFRDAVSVEEHDKQNWTTHCIMAEKQDLEAVLDGGDFKVTLRVVRPHSIMPYEPEMDVDAPVSMLKEDMEDVIHVPAWRQQWLYMGVEMDDHRPLSHSVQNTEVEIMVHILPESPQGQ